MAIKRSLETLSIVGCSLGEVPLLRNELAKVVSFKEVESYFIATVYQDSQLRVAELIFLMSTVRCDSLDARHFDWVVFFVDAHGTVETEEYAMVNAHVINPKITYKELAKNITYHSQSSTDCNDHSITF